ncbi:nucleotide disphospho-sugar-binding domain-containing protein [Micromonospora sp. NPDC050980]|uniref:nucleotide disphospho-sugar-binding domain-containing protein n=1 Tax=Micromonospora sp. NPDC050980 TaxID=3155161 RepID=UPI0033FA9E39
MRVMCTVSAWPSHYYPMVPVLWALRAAGHEVLVACPPSQAGPVSRAGLTPAPELGELAIPFLARLRNVWDAQAGTWPYDWVPPHPVTGADMSSLAEFGYADFARASRQLIAEPVARGGQAAIDLARRWRPDLILHEPLSMEGLLAARVVGVPSAVHLWGPVGTHEDDPAIRAVVEYPVGSFTPHRAGPLTLDTVTHVIDPCPAGLAPPVDATRLAVRYTPYNGPGTMPTWVLEPPERQRVTVVWGSSLTAMFGPPSLAVRLILAALADLDVEVLVGVAGQDLDGVGPTPANVRLLDGVPLHVALPGSAAVVHHGGAGCLMTSVAAGVPQLVLPTGMDQPANAARLAATGAAIRLPRAEATVQRIRDAVTSLLDVPEHRRAAQRLAARNEERPTPAGLVTDLEKLAAG